MVIVSMACIMKWLSRPLTVMIHPRTNRTNVKQLFVDRNQRLNTKPLYDHETADISLSLRLCLYMTADIENFIIYCYSESYFL